MNKRRFIFLFSLVLLILLVGLAEAQTKKKPTSKDLSPQYRKWLEEEVVYIIKPKEKDVFLQLESDREREMFIAAFWKARDSNLDTEKNESKEEHYRRISYANQWFGRDTPGPGWRTDMGRIYILLGEAKAIEKYENLSEIFPTIIWFYEGMSPLGLPNAFNVVFFKRNGVNEYVVYSPVRHGPQSLLVHFSGDMTNYEAALSELYKIEPNVAEIAITLMPGESRATLSPSIASEILLSQKIPEAPMARIKDDYAENLLRYRNIIEVDYTSNYVESENVVKVFRDETGTANIHYLMEPASLKFLQNDKGFHSEIEIIGKVDDLQGRTIYQFQRTSPIDFNPGQMAGVRNKLFSFQDMFPIIPGRFKLDILFKNKVSREFASFATELLVPEPTDFSMSLPVLANKADPNSRYKGQKKPFLLNGTQLIPSPRNDFQVNETAYVFFQLYNLPPNVREGGRIEYSIFKGATKVVSVVKAVADLPDRANIHQEFPLTGLSPAYYSIRIAVLSADGVERFSTEIPFFITAILNLARPFIMSLPQLPSLSPEGVHILGLQYLNSGNPARAKPLLEDAFRRVPQNPSFALDFCRLLLEVKDFAGLKTAAQPFLSGAQRYEFLQPAGQACQALGEYPQAIVYFKDYLAYYGTNIIVLNSVGDCYEKLENIPEALIAWEKSLELEKNQPGLQEKVRFFKNKK